MSEKISTTQPYDCVVLGTGGIGSAALLASARRGWRTLGVDQFGIGHAHGSSHGQTRIIRTAYFEHPNYVPLAETAFEKWDEIQRFSDRKIVDRVGLIQSGDPNSEVIRGTLESVNRWNLPVEEWTPTKTMERFPAFKVPEDHTVLFETNAGYLRVEWCVATVCRIASNLGASIASNFKVIRWHVTGDQIVHVEGTYQGEPISISTKRLIVTAGSWASQILPGLALDLQVIRKQQHWFQLNRVDIKAANGFPCFLFDTDAGTFYGFPEIDYLGLKIAEHSGGQKVAGPDGLDRTLQSEELEKSVEFLNSHFIFDRQRKVYDSVCIYTRSRDEHFIVDNHPDHPQVAFAAGLSGHGFKFAPVIGERLVDLAAGESGAFETQMEFLKLAGRGLEKERTTDES